MILSYGFLMAYGFSTMLRSRIVSDVKRKMSPFVPLIMYLLWKFRQIFIKLSKFPSTSGFLSFLKNNPINYWDLYKASSGSIEMIMSFFFFFFCFSPLILYLIPGEGSGNQLQYSCLQNSIDRGGCQAASPQGHKESDTT